MRALRDWSTRVSCLICALSMAACTPVPRRAAPPTHFFGPVAPVGFPATVRSLGVDRSFYTAHMEETRQRLRRAAAGGALNILALSGGGAGGAFGAGALVGMSRREERPQFAVVTGVSTGALLAPFAFLGSAWDEQLIDVFASRRAERLLQSRGIGILFRPGIYQTKPLMDLVNHFVTDALINAVAEQSSKGRSLLVATTDLDKEETVIWDMGAIATHGGPAARNLFRDVLVASASIPGLFAPVLIHVEGSGTAYDEMHVDGGTTVPFFFVPEIAELMAGEAEELQGANLYVIVNGQFSTLPHTTPQKSMPILARSLSAELGHTARTTLALSAAFAQQHGMKFLFSEIPIDYPYQGPLDFHSSVLLPLFDFALRCATNGRFWTTPAQALESSERALSASPAHTVQCPAAQSAPTG